MTNIKAVVTGAKIALELEGTLTAGMVGVPVTFSFDESWEGLSKTAVFRAGGLTMDVIGVEAAAIIPWEVLNKPHCTLYVGVHGVDAEGSVVIPTLWESAGVIQPGADPNMDSSANPGLPVWEQVMQVSAKTAQAMADEAVDKAAAYAESLQQFAQDESGCYYRERDAEVEYLNPLYAVNTEYRTPFYYKGASLYTKLVKAVAPSEKGQTSSTCFASGVTHIVRTQVCEVYRTDGTIYSDSGVLRIYSRITGPNGYVAVELPAGTVGTAYNGAEVYVLMEYTK